jgi:phospholipid/cholesterol/gamma-HCH transport system substrate-binding protein
MKKEVTIAITACVAVVILFFGLNFLKGMTIFSSDNSYYVRFHDIQGLSKANPIYADGYKVGVVKDIYYDYAGNGDVIVKFDVDNNLRIPKGSTAEVGSDLMGNVKMNLLMANNPRERVNPGDTIQGATNSGLMGRVAQILPTVEALVPKIDSILTSVNALLADPALAATLHNAQQITSNLTTTSQQLNVLMANLNKSVPGMLNKADATLANTQKLTNNLAAVDIQTTMNEVNSTISNLKTFTDNLNNGKGSLGLLMNDPGLYNNLNSTMISADSLLIDLKAHPKRYVHFSLFGKKDK